MIAASSAGLGTLHSQRIVFSGTLMKRCQLSWKPRYVELVAQPKSVAGHKYSFQLLLYDPRKQHLKNCIQLEQVVMLRSSMDCHFQLYLPDSKILQLRTESPDKQAQWMALIKVGLGRGSIFHVQVNAVENLQHAMLYSIQVQLPAHRIGQLDRVLVLASPINDMAIQAWDLNRVQRFFQLDIGVRMEMCGTCLQSAQEKSITFVMDQRFIADCIKFLCREAHINSHPVNQNGFTVYNVPHYCFYSSNAEEKKTASCLDSVGTQPVISTTSKRTSDPSPGHEYDYPSKPQTLPETAAEKKTKQPARPAKLKPQSNNQSDSRQPYFPFPEEVWEDYSDSKQKQAAKRNSLPPRSSRTGIEMMSSIHSTPASLPLEITNRDDTNSLTSSHSPDTSLGESVFMAEGLLFDIVERSQVLNAERATSSEPTLAAATDVPPRNIPRAKHETSVPASGLHYYNFQPQLKPQHENTLMKVIPIPPRGLRADTVAHQQASPTPVAANHQSRPIPARVKRQPVEEATSSGESTMEASGKDVKSYEGEIVPLSSLQFYSRQHSANPDLSNYETAQRVAAAIAQKGSRKSEISNGNDSDDDDGDYEYMSHYSVRSQQMDSTYPFSLVALDLSSLSDKSNTKLASSQQSKQSSWNSSGRGFGSLIRTFSDSSLNCSKSSVSYGRRPSFEYSSKTSSTSSWDEDCYVMMSPSSLRKAEDERCFSPSYVRDMQFLEKMVESNQDSQKTPKQTLMERKKESSEKKISLTDAGHVIREDWAMTLEELRREHAKIAKQVEQVVRAQTGEDKLDLNEIAYLDWRSKEEVFKRDEKSNTTTANVFFDNSPAHDYDFLKPLKPKYEHSHSVPSSPSSPFKLFPQFPPTTDHNNGRSPSIPRSSAVVNKSTLKSIRMDGNSAYSRSTSLPRSTVNLTQTNSDGKTTKFEHIQPLPILSNPTVLAEKPRSRESSVESEEDMEYVHEFIAIGSLNRKPVPVPRRPQKPFDSSQQASMVTMGIFRDISSSDGNVYGTYGEGRSKLPTWLQQSISTSDVRQ